VNVRGDANEKEGLVGCYDLRSAMLDGGRVRRVILEVPCGKYLSSLGCSATCFSNFNAIPVVHRHIKSQLL
jgi:hypothetical protein